MGRYTDQDSDVERLPEGFERIGYDADTETYSFRDTQGTMYESEPGNRYGPLYPSGSRPRLTSEEIAIHNATLKAGNRESVKMMLPFALVVLVFLLLVFKFLGGSGDADQGKAQVKCQEGFHRIYVQPGDSCWAIGKQFGLSTEELLSFQGNEEVVCEKLDVGQSLCVPE
ncbi:hypothetical protein P280DRAFT_472337 [Massarina eburnea CBS 473.64]|uniref:LysM domain-containing protein n=1 Tax=Massarina eburnea CBS 473.64 TaxID=1395130 RepID=A0A6A6RPB4_9PLEO|nr:hypothetical protein P280DRAFT_472337 [Massarina eburnea CBS 473.64]